MAEAFALRCLGCGREYPAWSVDYFCPHCGFPGGSLEIVYDLDAPPHPFPNHANFSLWRYEALLPVNLRFAPPLRAGSTPLYAAPQLAKALGVRILWLKDDTLQPTSSCKDRGTAVAVAAARKLGRHGLCCASTGNAAASLAGFAAASAMPTYIFVPKTAPLPKIAQLQAFGARVFRVDGTYEQAFSLALAASDKFGWYNRSDGLNPMVVEGNKTVSFEIWEELGDVPDAVVVAVGDGAVIAGVCKGFLELAQAGLVKRVPKVFGVQAAGAAPLAQAFHRFRGGKPLLPAEGPATTIADSICVGKPAAVVPAVKYVAKTHGDYVTVNDAELIAASLELARKAGIFAEPSGAAPLAGLRRLLEEGLVSQNDRVVLIITGSGLKAPQAVLGHLPEPPIIPPDIQDLSEVIKACS
ncbi:MAG: threonine synthase [Candidatus Bipolaricaulota bacterium]|nr:threonine synthase [Candidatus Bipolaricaulota bacterium]MDW8126699.1 threonine synthase [Candidatus Bipolaricaulota bacterium]